MEYLGYVFVGIVTLLLVCIPHWLRSWRKPQCNGKLPPGSMGWPILGETLQFSTPYTNRGVSPFIRKRMDRYGPLFRTKLLGWPFVISADPDVSRFVLQQEGKLFHCWYMESFDNLFGPQNVLSSQGALHKCLRSLILSQFGSESLRTRVLSQVEELVLKKLQLWSNHTSVDLKEGITSMMFDFTAKMICNYDESKTPEKLRENYSAFLSGLISFPLNIPGTSYWKCLKGRERARKTLRNRLLERLASPEREHKDIMDFIIQEMKKDDTILTEEIAVDLLFGLPFGANETTSSTLILAVQYLGSHPSALAEITREHESILRNRKQKDSGITWEEYKSMSFTMMVVNETVRMGSILPSIFRKVDKDIEIKGYTIPAGWMVLVSPPAAHFNPNVHKDPHVFNPWRWQGQEPTSGSNALMGFGGGIKLCAGVDFAKLEIAIFLHHLVTKYRWEVIKGGEVVWRQSTGPIFPNGFHVRISEKTK
ncbi:hypothetical protein VitviT2T_025001 [Vitis vinifera]|uniref:Cytochrome P450 87A3 n=2 Tax=Vitis vinifera TaxID=29760 RepID=A0ABY9DKB2_VITVI|eukprot:XP_010662510.1 PREDICTED: cytochrome P450 87A3 [Vitis vinifera]